MALRMPTAAASVAACLCLASLAAAAEPSSLGRFRDWEAFAADEAGGKVCYALTAPRESRGDYTNRDPAFVMVTRRPAEGVFDEVSAIAGYNYQQGSQPEIRVDNRSFEAAPVNDVAWPRLRETPALVSAMKAGTTLRLEGVSSRGTKTEDEFSLLGFTAALQAIQKSCPKP